MVSTDGERIASALSEKDEGLIKMCGDFLNMNSPHRQICVAHASTALDINLVATV